MTQTLTNSILAVKARAQKEEQTKPIAGAMPTFWDKEREREAKDFENKELQNAVALGKLRANAFFAELHDRKHPNQEKVLAAWKGTYAMNSKKVEDDIVQKTCEELNARPFAKQDTPYEERIHKKYQPVNEALDVHSYAMFQNFKQELQDKQNSKGYLNDKAFVPALAEKYGLKSNDQVFELRNLELK